MYNYGEMSFRSDMLGFGFALLSITVPTLGLAQDPPKITIKGSVEQIMTNGRFGGSEKTRDRLTKPTLIVESGNWALRGSYLYYPFCMWYETDETHLSYESNNFTWKFGRFITPVGQANWDTEWYSGFTFVPMIDLQFYHGFNFRERTTPGTSVEYVSGPYNFAASLSDPHTIPDRLLPHKLDRASLRTTWYHDGLQIGASGLFDTETFGSGEQMLSVDARFTIPNFQIRGEYLTYQSQTEHDKGFVVEASYRPPTSTDVTFVGRFEGIAGSPGSAPAKSNLETWTLGGKFRLPWDTRFLLNYTGGPDMNRVFLGGAWTFGLTKTLRF